MAASWSTLIYGLVLVTSAIGARIARSPQEGSSSASYSGSSSNGINTGYGGGGFYFPFQQPFMPFQFDFNQAFQQHMAQMAALQAQAQAQQAQAFAFPGFVNSNGLGPDSGMAMSSVNYGPSGGFQAASASGPDGIGLRIASENLPPPSGGGTGSFGTFSSSSSSSSDVDGQRTSHHQSAVGVNDNGKIYFKSVSTR